MKTLVNTYLKHNPPRKDIVYHYCSVNTLLSIISRKSLWLSDSTKTNDKYEVFWLLSNISKVIDQSLGLLIERYTPQLLEKSLLISELIKKAADSYEIADLRKSKKFITCFSEDGDLLSQWRAYADDGNGVAIGFNAEYLLKYENIGMYDFTKVIYDPKITAQFIEAVTTEQLRYALMNYSENNEETNRFLLDIALLLNSIYEEGYVFKNPSFHEEQEWRLVRKATASNWDTSDGVDDYGYSDMIEGFFIPNGRFLFSRSELKFRSKKNDLIPYIELGFEVTVKPALTLWHSRPKRYNYLQ